jgi:hypothetical protein
MSDYRTRLMRKAIRAAAAILRSDRDSFVEANSVLDRRTMRPIPDSLNDDALIYVTEYDDVISLCERALAPSRRRS